MSSFTYHFLLRLIYYLLLQVLSIVYYYSKFQLPFIITSLIYYLLLQVISFIITSFIHYLLLKVLSPLKVRNAKTTWSVSTWVCKERPLLPACALSPLGRRTTGFHKHSREAGQCQLTSAKLDLDSCLINAPCPDDTQCCSSDQLMFLVCFLLLLALFITLFSLFLFFSVLFSRLSLSFLSFLYLSLFDLS